MQRGAEMRVAARLNSIQKYREVLGISLPIAGVQLAGVALTTTDVLMLQSVGVLAIAGGGLAMQLYNQIRTMCVGMVTASSNLVAEAAAEMEREEASGQPSEEGAERIRRAVRSSFAVGTGTAILGALLVITFGALVLALPIDEQVARLTFAMTLTLAPGLIPMLWLNVLRQFAVGMRKPGSLLAITLVSIFVNIALNWSFMAWATSDTWKVAGIGLSTTTVQLFTLLAFRVVVLRIPELQPYFQVLPRAGDGETIRHLVRLGVPVSLTYGSEAAITTIAGLVMGTLSPQMLAAHNVVNQLAYIVYQVCIGFSHGGSVLITRARAEGANAVRAVTRHVLLVVVVYLGVMGALWLLLGRWVLRPFLGSADATTFHIAVLLLCLAVLQQFSKGIQNVTVGLLRGLKDTTSGLRCTLIGYWLVGVPGILVMGKLLRWEGYGVWWGLIAGFATTAVLLLRTYSRRLASIS